MISVAHFVQVYRLTGRDLYALIPTWPRTAHKKVRDAETGEAIAEIRRRVRRESRRRHSTHDTPPHVRAA